MKIEKIIYAGNEYFCIVVKKCPKCGGAWKDYDGLMGYESSVCAKCGYDVKDTQVIAYRYGGLK